MLGVALTVGGLVTVSWGGEKTSYKKSELIYPFLCALLFSMKDVAVRWGLGGGGGQPILAAGIAALTSTIEILLITRYLQAEPFILPPAPVARWFIGSGIHWRVFFIHVFGLQPGAGLDRRAVGQQLYGLCLDLTPFMARRIETVTARKLAGATLVVAGIFAVSLGKD